MFSNEQTSTGQPAKTYIHRFCADTECHLEDLLRAMDDRYIGQELSKESIHLAACDNDAGASCSLKFTPEDLHSRPKNSNIIFQVYFKNRA